jgi:hypothetical protein
MPWKPSINSVIRVCKIKNFSSILADVLLRAGRSGDRIPVGTRLSAPVQTGPGVHPASCTMGTGSFPGVKSSRDVTLIFHPFLVPRSEQSRAILLLPLWAVRPVQSLSACTNVHFTLLADVLLRAGRSGDRIPLGVRFPARPDRPWGPPSLLYNGYRVFPGGKVRPGRVAAHSPPSSAVVLEE